MKEPYEAPQMVTEEIETLGVLNASNSSPIAQLQPYFGLCDPCDY